MHGDGSLRGTIAALSLACALTLGGCSSGGAAELLSTAELEEVQQNIPHARELYAEIVSKYPDSPEAATARARLAALGSGASGAPAAGQGAAAPAGAGSSTQ
jgi:hypothetical protein